MIRWILLMSALVYLADSYIAAQSMVQDSKPHVDQILEN